MEKLEKTLQEVSFESLGLEKIGEDDSYEGLQLIESRSYKGYTSIKYWM